MISDHLIDTCNGTYAIETNSQWQLKSPGYPEEYEPNMYCEWHITAPAGYNIIFQLKVALCSLL